MLDWAENCNHPTVQVHFKEGSRFVPAEYVTNSLDYITFRDGPPQEMTMTILTPLHIDGYRFERSINGNWWAFEEQR